MANGDAAGVQTRPTNAIVTSRSDVFTFPRTMAKHGLWGFPHSEDKLVQDAVREVLQAVYEQDFLDCSYGFRPGRSAHDAVRHLAQVAD